VLKVYVQQKRPAAEVDPAELVPAAFEGIPTDIGELPPHGTSSLTAPKGKELLPAGAGDTERYRPLVGGCQFAADIAIAGPGTLGCMLTTPGDPSKVYALTNWHVFTANGQATPVVGTTKVGQPAAEDSVTKCCSSMIGKIAGGGRDTTRDAGLALLDPGTQWSADILEIGAIAGAHPITVAEAQSGTYAVRKRGRTSGLTGGVVDSITGTWDAGGQIFNNVILVRPNPDPSLPASTDIHFAQSGDSGAAYVNDANEVVGIHVSHAVGTHGLVTSAGIPITAVIGGFAAVEHLTVQVATAAHPGIVQTVPGAAMVALPPELAPSPAATPVRVPVVTGTSVEAPAEAALARLQHDLDRSRPGRALLTLWLRHQSELLTLLNTNRRVATAWHRSGASAVFQRLVRMLSDPDLELPSTLNGEPVHACLDRVCESIARAASPTLRRDLDSARRALPELGGMTYDGIHAALGMA
jgi:hypothetical protein